MSDFTISLNNAGEIILNNLPPSYGTKVLADGKILVFSKNGGGICVGSIGSGIDANFGGKGLVLSKSVENDGQVILF